ncbi:MAG: hypothetical protein ABOK23_05835 [Candidatus Methanoperedens sp.]|nr:hypothetical protein [Candidatus Methanoperedens sp.]MCZ7396520.1 hypothetical protein [Candidatus Methanoperedens sp.]
MTRSWHFEPKARRIVDRVDQLMSLCDKLEAGLMRSQADSERLMEAVVSGCLRKNRIMRISNENKENIYTILVIC